MRATRRWLVELTRVKDPAAVGGKAFNLARLQRLNVPTPRGSVIPDGVFQRHLVNAGVLEDIQRLGQALDTLPEPAIVAASTAIRQRIAVTALEPELTRALADTWATQWHSQRLAVRSSAVGEDCAQTSFAGQLDSFLNVDSGSALHTAIKATWSSAFAPPALLYARHHRLRVEHMGVIVQPQVNAQLSGVLFTRDPSGRREGAMVAEYCTGLGEQLMNGSITPSRLCIDRSDLLVQLEYAAGQEDALDAATIRTIQGIARIGLRLESSDGVAQDLEWCIDGDGQALIVQARPARQLPTAASRVHWTNANIAENFPDPVSPLLFSIVKPGYSAYFRNLGLGFGVSRRRLRAMEEPLKNIVGLQGGRLYYNLTNIHALLQMMPAGRQLVAAFNLFVGAAQIPAPPVTALNPVTKALEAARIGVAIGWQYLFIQRRLARFEHRVDRFAGSTRRAQLANKSATALAVDLERFLTIRLTQWNDAALADTAAMVCYGLLKAQLARGLAGSDQTAIHNDLLKGLPGLASAAPVSRLWALSRQIEGDPALLALFTGHSAEQILHRLSRDPVCRNFSRSFADYLEHWGFRSSGELMLTAVTPEENPRPLLRLLQAYVVAPAASPEDLTRIQRRQREAATARVAAQLSPARCWRWVPLASRASRFRILLAATQGAIKLRERARMKQALLYTRLRHIALALGDRLTASGVLRHREDVFLLTVHELLDLAMNRAKNSHDLEQRLESRRAALAQHQTENPPDRLALAAGEQYQPSAATVSDQDAGPVHKLHGSGACGGSALGRAAVVLDVANAHRVQAGQILVTRQTDPGWASVFFLVQGLVIERGGMLSHGAIIAREYGIPAVVGVPSATRLIHDGDQIRVDGDHGCVELNGR